MAQPRVAVVHDWLVTYGGAERVLEQILKLYPQADLFALYDFIPPDRRDFILNKTVTTSFLQRFPFAGKKYRSYLPLMPLAVEQFDMSAYDLVISNSYAVAKGVITGPDQVHISYVQSPMRYAWDLTHQYLRQAGLRSGPKSWFVRWTLHRIRTWDARTANGVDEFIANSHFIARRIWKVYRRKATVINPPVAVDAFGLRTKKDDFYLTASRMVPYKRIDLIVDAFAHMPDKKLVVIGDGPDFRKIAGKTGPNVTLLGYQPFEVLRDHMQRARAFVFAAEEDFGIVPVEAQACGTPVIAFGKGGVLETVVDGETGMFFDEQLAESVAEAVRTFDRCRRQFDPAKCRENALRFSIEEFRQHFKTFVNDTLSHSPTAPRQSPGRKLSLKGRTAGIPQEVTEDDLL
jgi:glycosyltransferase involved in cell wall biosynthesis